MTFRLSLIFMAFLTVLPAVAQAQGKPVFRGFIWGVSPEDVKKFERALYYDDKNGLAFFEDTKAGRVVYRYDFQDDKLWRIHKQYQDLHYPTVRAVLDLVADEKAALTKKYGVPSRDELVWVNRRYRNIGPWFERAFAMGEVRIEAEWQVDDTSVTLKSYNSDPYYELTTVYENKTATNDAVQSFDLFKFNE